MHPSLCLSIPIFSFVLRLKLIHCPLFFIRFFTFFSVAAYVLTPCVMLYIFLSTYIFCSVYRCGFRKNSNSASSQSQWLVYVIIYHTSTLPKCQSYIFKELFKFVSPKNMGIGITRKYSQKIRTQQNENEKKN